MTQRPQVVIDCDPGHDDLIAIAVAASHCELLGITTVAGNAPLAATTRNALVACELFGLDVPVHAGAAHALVAEPPAARSVHGSTGLDGPAPIEPSRGPAGDDAVAFLVETARAVDGLWLLATGPLTNVALALRASPDLADRLAGISLMGGSATSGNVTATAEFNVSCDPEAAAAVFTSGVPIRMCGLDLTHQVAFSDDDISGLRAANTTATSFVADCLAFYLDAVRQLTHWKTAPLHDPCAVLALTHPDLFDMARRRVDVELAGTLTRGMTVVDERGWDPPEKRNVDLARRVDAVVAKQLIFDAVRERNAIST
jgi:inosine-uridine nucleoside N-ribohydrolase